MASAADAPQMATASAGKNADISRLSPSNRDSGMPARMVVATRRDDGKNRNDAEARDLSRRDPHAEQRHADPEDGTGRKLDPGNAAAFLVQKVECHAEEQCEQHDRRAVMLRKARTRRALS